MVFGDKQFRFVLVIAEHQNSDNTSSVLNLLEIIEYYVTFKCILLCF